MLLKPIPLKSLLLLLLYIFCSKLYKKLGIIWDYIDNYLNYAKDSCFKYPFPIYKAERIIYNNSIIFKAYIHNVYSMHLRLNLNKINNRLC